MGGGRVGGLGGRGGGGLRARVVRGGRLSRAVGGWRGGSRGLGRGGWVALGVVGHWVLRRGGWAALWVKVHWILRRGGSRGTGSSGFEALPVPAAGNKLTSSHARAQAVATLCGTVWRRGMLFSCWARPFWLLASVGQLAMWWVSTHANAFCNLLATHRASPPRGAPGSEHIAGRRVASTRSSARDNDSKRQGYMC
jgi:hypothetical protein